MAAPILHTDQTLQQVLTMNTQTLIIGGGLTGLSLAYRLEQAGHDYQLIEARTRFGGRIKSLTLQGQNVDLGPSWIWAGQHRVAALLDQLNLQMFDQYSTGAQAFEQANGQVAKDTGFMSMAGSMRIAGGTTALTDALVAKLDPARLHKGIAVTGIADGPGVTLSNGETHHAQRIVIAVPPRIAGALTYTPALPQDAIANLNAIPTWMGAHAKFVAVYPTPFWRADGLSGDASSRRGPMVEIHDASPTDGSLGALFGFVGLPADARAKAGPALADAALEQLANIFGPRARSPLSTQLEDWSQAPFTATAADAIAPPGHPHYTMPPALQNIWNGQLIFAVTELTSDNGGLIEGALAASERAANQILQS